MITKYFYVYRKKWRDNHIVFPYKTFLEYISYVIQCYSYTIVNLLISEITKRCLND